MPQRTRALKVISKAEAELRLLIETAARSGDYREVRSLAKLAEALAGLRGPEDPAGTVSAGRGAEPSNARGPRQSPTARRRRVTRRASLAAARNRSANETEVEAAGYPRFVRDDEKLVKIGWSDRDQSTYEHRAPIESVLSVVARIGSLGADGRPFRMDEVLPLNGSAGEVPSYQAYLALAWLRSHNLVDRAGKTTYLVTSSDDLLARARHVWAGTRSLRSMEG